MRNNKIKTYHFVNRDLYYQEAIDYDFLRPKFLQDAKFKRANINKYIKEDGSTKIPLITHQIYFSDAVNPISGVNLKHSIITTNRLNEVAEFRHYIWTNDLNLIPQELRDIKGVEVRLISELASFRLFKELKLLISQENINKYNFAMASDILRIMILREFGGIYHDLDYYIINSSLLLEYLKAFDFIAAELHPEEYYFIGNAFIASIANHPVMQKATQLIQRNLNNNSFQPDYIKYPYNMFSKILYYNWSCNDNDCLL